MKQYEAVILTLEKLGGQATLGELNKEVLKINECEWKTKTPFASIRRIVQIRPEIFRVRPGLWALRSYQKKLNIVEFDSRNNDKKYQEENHSYFQGLVAKIGNFRNFSTYIPNQDKNKLFIQTPLGEIRSLESIPQYSYPEIVQRSGTIDVIWFNKRRMPDSFFEVEHSTDIQNSLLKFFDLQDFFARMVIVADEHRYLEFQTKIKYNALADFSGRVKFLGYSALVQQYEGEIFKSTQDFLI
jgi:hypothetical protein